MTGRDFCSLVNCCRPATCGLYSSRRGAPFQRGPVIGIILYFRIFPGCGSTALNDALCSIRFGPQSLDREKVFVVVSDFEDNSSRKSKEEMIQTMQTDAVRVFVLLRPWETERLFHMTKTSERKLLKRPAAMCSWLQVKWSLTPPSSG